MTNFNEWMAYIYRLNGHPESKIKLYEQNCRREAFIQNDQRWAEQDRRDAHVGTDQDFTITSRN